MNRRIVGACAPMLLVAAAGLAQQPPGTPPYPGPDRPSSEPSNRAPDTVGRDTDRMQGQQARSDLLIKVKNVLGAKVVNKSNESLGKIDDLLIDARSGHAVYGVLSHGGVLGIGDKLIALPWHAMEVLPVSDGDATVMVEMAKDRLKDAPSFDKDQWSLLGESSWTKKSHEYFGTEPTWNDSWGRDAVMTRDWDKGKNLDFKGRIDKVEHRSPGRGMSEGVVLTVQGDDQREHTVVLGPTWYVQAQPVMPREGDDIEVHAREIHYRDGTTVVAREVTLKSGEKLTLRETNGRPIWDTMAPEGAGRDTEPRVFVRASEMKGKDVRGTGDNKIGDVQEMAINPNTGRIPFLVVTSGGVAGMGSREVVVPWSAIRFVKKGNEIALNADEATLKSAPQLEKAGFALVNDPQFRQRVRSFFGSGYGDDAMFRTGDASAGGWTSSSEYNHLYKGSPTTVKGTILSVQTKPPMKGMSDATVIKIKTGEGERTVQLGPSWFVNRQNLNLVAGDEVTIKGVKANVQGEDVVLASEITTSSGTLRFRDDTGRPNWDAIRIEREKEREKEKERDR